MLGASLCGLGCEGAGPRRGVARAAERSGVPALDARGSAGPPPPPSAAEPVAVHAPIAASRELAYPPPSAAASVATSPPPSAADPRSVPSHPPASLLSFRPLKNRFAYIPPQCYASTRREPGQVANPCYVCHAHSLAPNYVDDADLQQQLKLPPLAADNAWSNLFSPPPAPAWDDTRLLAYVRSSNYFNPDGEITLSRRLAALPQAWDGEGDGKWGGFVPDAYFAFDARGFDHRPDGTPTGWRAIAYYPLPGAFFPSNGSFGDVLMRLDDALCEDADGRVDLDVTRINFAIVEALISRRDVPIDPIDERRFDVDLDRNGVLGPARRVQFDQQLQYVGRATALTRAGKFPIAPGLFPLGTAFLHTLRYLDVDRAGAVVMAKRMKELRYAKKVSWFSDADLKAHAAREALERIESATGAHEVSWQFERGVYNGQGWLLQGFIEAADGSLRPETHEETAQCVGCHGGVGVTADSMFSFARKLSAPAGGYFHWTQHDLRGLPEPRRADGSYEYTLYLEQNRAGDDYGNNREIVDHFFDRAQALRPERVRELHRDIASLLVPSPARALALDRAALATVLEQSFSQGREPVLQPSAHVQRHVDVTAPTGIEAPVPSSPTLSLRR
jgi:hypothetical protein